MRGRKHRVDCLPSFERQLAVALCERLDDFAALGQRRFEHLGDERE
jgi:hypothetical protein